MDWRATILRTFGELRRRRVFRALAVYVLVGWLLIQVGDATFEPLGFPAWAMKLLIVLLGLGFVLALVLAWIYDIGAQGLERTPPAVPVSSPPEASVAILPFTDLSEARDQDYFCEGLAEEILNALASVDGLRVASRTSSFRFGDGATDVREIGRALNVAAIMEGSVRKAGGQVRVTAQLVDAGNGYHLWSANFDRRLEDIFAIQEEIARSVADALRVSLKGSPGIDFRRYAPKDMRAYDFYLRGRQLEAKTTMESWRAAPSMFRSAIALDPEYAQAHAGLADALTELLLWRMVKPEEVLEEALAASKRALELAPELAEAHVANAHTLSLAGEDAAATVAFERAIELNPDLYEAFYYFARHCFVGGHSERAVALYEAAHRARPDEFQALTLATGAAAAAGQAERKRELAGRALEACLHQVALDPKYVRALYCAALMQLQVGDVEVGRAYAETALALRPDDYGTLYNCACFYAMAGEPERALDLLERASTVGQGFQGWIDHDTDLDSLRGMPRFQALRTKLDSMQSPDVTNDRYDRPLSLTDHRRNRGKGHEDL